MAFRETELAEIKTAIDEYLRLKRPPPEIRDKLDIVCLVDGQSMVVAELRPVWRNPSETMTIPMAKATYVRSHGWWKVFWKRKDLKWHRYDPTPVVPTVKAFFRLITEDKYHCFWG